MSTIKRSKRKTPFVQMDKHALQNKNLSWKAKGLLAYLLSLPDDWQIYVSELKEHATDGRDGTTRALNELIKSNYISRTKIRNDKGRFSGYDYIVFDSPYTDKPETEKPFTEKPNSVKPISEKPKLLIIEDNNNINTDKEISTKKIKDLERYNKDLKKQLEEALKNQKPKQKRTMFIAPTLEATIEYFEEKGSTKQEATNFWNHYESNGWKVGKNKMVKWKNSAGGWIGRNRTYPPTSSNKGPINGQAQIINNYYKEYIPTKVLTKNPAKFNDFESKFKSPQIYNEVCQYRSQIQIQNPTLTPYLIFDIMYGLIEKGGTTPQRRFKNFKGWLVRFAEKSDYKANKGDLRKEYKKYLNSKF